jgi:hypothetical protein
VGDAGAGEARPPEELPVSSYRYKPSKPVAIMGAVFGAAILVFGLVSMVDSGLDGGGTAFLVLWCVAGVAIISLNLWAAFSRNGSLATFTRAPEGNDEDAGGARSPG